MCDGRERGIAPSAVGQKIRSGSGGKGSGEGRHVVRAQVPLSSSGVVHVPHLEALLCDGTWVAGKKINRRGRCG